MAIGSASKSEYCRLLLAELRMERFFSHVVGGDMVAQGKPAPELFLLASNLLDTSPERCIVVGDSVHDFHAAKNAGMHAIALRPHGKMRGEYLHGAYPIAHLREITVQLLESLTISAH
jgi:beta-phosphoglucomutase-like phosphatase (HAD superfamily)